MKQDIAEIAGRVSSLHQKLAQSHPSLARGQVWCRKCGSTKRVDSANALRFGWPKCCGATMTIDSPEEQAAHLLAHSHPEKPPSPGIYHSEVNKDRNAKEESPTR